MSLGKSKEIRHTLEDTSKINRSILANIILLAISSSMIYIGLLLIHEKASYVISKEAYVNGVIIDINTPQSGNIVDLNIATGDRVRLNQLLLTIKNNRVSNLPAKNVQSRYNEAKEKLQQAYIYLGNLNLLLKQVKEDEANQFLLEQKEAQEKLEKEKVLLKAAESRYNLAKINYIRVKKLWEEGVYSRSQYEEIELEISQKLSEIESIQSNIAQLDANVQASLKGLNLNRTRSNYDPRIRLQELNIQISVQEQLIINLNQNIKDLAEEQQEVEKDIIQTKSISINSPVNGIIWKTNVQPGKYVFEGNMLVQLLDCNRRWLDVLVDESSLDSIQLGANASIKLYGIKETEFKGRIAAIRSGVGRLNPGEDVAILPEANLPRSAQNRVEFASNLTKETEGLFCLVGHTGRVKFLKKSN